MKKIPAIQSFLKIKAAPGMSDLFGPGMECQVNVAPDGGTRVTGEYMGKTFHSWKDEETGEEWKSFRIPYNAWSQPEYTDKNLRWDMEKHCESVGVTGWDWVARASRFVAFDFDSVANHSNNALTDVELSRIQAAVASVPWVTVRRSKSGRGLHLYVHLETPVPTANHNEHAALARSILTLLSATSGTDLNSAVDCCGTVVWIWHRDTGERGFELVKQGVPLAKVPPDWKNHIDVVSKRSPRAAVPKATGVESDFEALIRQTRRVELDDDHKRLLAWFATQDSMTLWSWDPDRWMLQCHTFDLARAHKDLALRGVYYTSSTGKDRPDQNCFCFPMSSGGWQIRRHGKGIGEHPAWYRDPSGWTRCDLNVPATVSLACSAHGAAKDSKGYWHFDHLSSALKAVADLELSVDTKALEPFLGRKTRILQKKNEVFLAFERQGDEKVPSGWVRTKSWWEKGFSFTEAARVVEIPDEKCRVVKSDSGICGYYVYTRDEEWTGMGRQEAQGILKIALDPASAELAINISTDSPWRLVNKPFKPEYPGNREWNKNAAQLAVEAKEGDHPDWDKILNHLGTGLDDAVREDAWCQENGVVKGADYLRLWCASLFQHPEEPLPYLFLFSSKQMTGKSTLHEALSLLFKKGRGYVRADASLMSKNRFNGELSGAVLCVVEETDLRHNREAYSRIKDWTTGKTISIRALYENPHDEANCTHWIQCANSATHCPVEVGDTRIVMVNVNTLRDQIPKAELMTRLQDQAAAFLHTLTTMEIPATPERLRIPAILTSAKADQVEANMSRLDFFLKEFTVPTPGMAIPWGEFYDKFWANTEASQKPFWSQKRVRTELPGEFPRGKFGARGDTHIGNLRWKDAKPVESGVLVRRDDRLVRLES